eukprot:14542752-Alexandrium_andersonii.AAC.1
MRVMCASQPSSTSIPCARGCVHACVLLCARACEGAAGNGAAFSAVGTLAFPHVNGFTPSGWKRAVVAIMG